MSASSTSDVEEIGFSIAKGTTKHRMKGIAMNKLTRNMIVGGFGLLAALATGVGPAQASAPNGAPESKTMVGQADWRDGDQIVGYYQTPQACELAGQFGERSGDWDDHDCSYVGLGVRSGAWALRVASDDDWDRLGFGVPFRDTLGFPNQFRPVWPGQFRPGPVGHGQHGPVGHGPFGHGPVGHGPAGHGPVGHGPVGHGPVGHGPVGHGPVGHGPVGHGPVGHDPVGHDPVGHGPVGHGH
jgi:hypothetical protein